MSSSKPTPFCQAAIDSIKASGQNYMDAYSLREAVMAKGFGKHPAAVAMHLTRLAWRREYLDSYTNDSNHRIFVLTSNAS